MFIFYGFDHVLFGCCSGLRKYAMENVSNKFLLLLEKSFYLNYIKLKFVYNKVYCLHSICLNRLVLLIDEKNSAFNFF